MSMIYSVITGTGSYIPTKLVKNEDFLSNEFYESNGEKIKKDNQEIIEKFQEITTIECRQHATDDQNASDLGFFAAEEAIKSANIDKEDLDYVIVGHNFGDVKADHNKSEYVPCLAAKIKQMLKIQNPNTVAYDITFGCPGWLQAVIQADYYIKSGDAKKILVIGTDTLSRISDPHDRDSMLYADGAGAVILEGKESDTPIGIIAHKTRTDSYAHALMLHMGKSYNPDYRDNKDLFIKMNGRRLYQYALETVPLAIKACLDKQNIHLSEIKKVLIHQANGKMDDAILARLYALYNIPEIPEHVMPMTISTLGNTSVATLPTLLDRIVKGKMTNHEINEGDLVIFASVGAGMNINAVIYKM